MLHALCTVSFQVSSQQPWASCKHKQLVHSYTQAYIEHKHWCILHFSIKETGIIIIKRLRMSKLWTFAHRCTIWKLFKFFVLFLCTDTGVERQLTVENQPSTRNRQTTRRAIISRQLTFKCKTGEGKKKKKALQLSLEYTLLEYNTKHTGYDLFKQTAMVQCLHWTKTWETQFASLSFSHICDLETKSGSLDLIWICRPQTTISADLKTLLQLNSVQDNANVSVKSWNTANSHYLSWIHVEVKNSIFMN